MKLLLSLLFICFSFFICHAQEKNSLQKFREDAASLKKLQGTSWKARRMDTAKRLQSQGNSFLQPGVHALKLDHMPCIIPDLSGVVLIPNAWPKKKEIPYRSNPPVMPNLQTKPNADTK